MLCLTDWMLVLSQYNFIIFGKELSIYVEMFCSNFSAFLLNSDLWYVEMTKLKTGGSMR